MLGKRNRRGSMKEKIRRRRKQYRSNKILMIKLSRIKSKTKVGTNNQIQIMMKQKTIKSNIDNLKALKINMRIDFLNYLLLAID